MVSLGFSGLLQMVMCNLHIIHKAFQYGCIEYGSKLESIINLYGWFKVRPYKREDIHAVSMELGEANPLFQCHLEIHCKAALQSSKRISYEFSAKTERSIQMLQIYGQISQPLNSEQCISVQNAFLAVVHVSFNKFLVAF